MEEGQKEYTAWRTMLLRNLALVIFFVFCVEIILYFLMERNSMISIDGNSYMLKYIIIPTSLNAADVIAGFCLMGRPGIRESRKNDIPLYCIAVFGFILSLVHARFPITAGIFMVPVLASVIYGSSRRMGRVTLVCLALAALLLVLPSYDTQISGMEAKINSALAFPFIGGAYLVGRAMLYVMKCKNEELERRRLESSALKESLRRDAMTGLYNHGEFYRYLEECISREEPGICVAVIDIDDFKRINDTYGHEKGDEVLKRLAELLQESCGAGSHISRYGGEEFAVVYTYTLLPSVRAAMEKLRAKLEQDCVLPEGIKISVSAGITAYNKGQTPQQVFERSDAALYDAKRSGKNKVIEL